MKILIIIPASIIMLITIVNKLDNILYNSSNHLAQLKDQTLMEAFTTMRNDFCFIIDNI